MSIPFAFLNHINSAPPIPTDVWIQRTPAGDGTTGWFGVAYGSGVFVAVGRNPGNIMTSPDGITWTMRSFPPGTNASNFRTIAYGLGMFAIPDANNSRILTSPDGITWTARATAVAHDFGDITFGGGSFVAVGGSGRILKSTNGVNWTNTTDLVQTYGGVSYGAGTFAAVGSGRIATSTNLISWTSRTVPTAIAGTLLSGVTYGAGRFVTVSQAAGATAQIATSTDGTTWNSITPAAGGYPSFSFTSVSFTNNMFLITGPGNTVVTSLNGILWQTQSCPIGSWNKIAGNGSGVFVGVSFNNAKLMSYHSS